METTVEAGILSFRSSPGIMPDRRTSPDGMFEARLDGSLYAQPLYWRPSGSNDGMLVVVATENDVVHAFDAITGNEIWKRVVGRPVPSS
jgi:outer membrane protein assembly factor BamB